MSGDYPNQDLDLSHPVPKEIAEKYSSRRYGLCPQCKHEDEVCKNCDSVQFPIISICGLFSEEKHFYHAKFERKEGAENG